MFFELGVGDGDVSAGILDGDYDDGVLEAEQRVSPAGISSGQESPVVTSPVAATSTLAQLVQNVPPGILHQGALTRMAYAPPPPPCGCGTPARDPVPHKIAAAVNALGGHGRLAAAVACHTGPVTANAMTTPELVAHLGIEGSAAALGVGAGQLAYAAGVSTSQAHASGLVVAPAKLRATAQWQPVGARKLLPENTYAVLTKGSQRAIPRRARQLRILPQTHRGMVGYRSMLGAVELGETADPSDDSDAAAIRAGDAAASAAMGGGGGASGNPPPSNFRPGNWDFDAGTYALAQGDTMFGLAQLYLGEGSRWLNDIWKIQPSPPRFHFSPDPASAAKTGLPVVPVGTRFIMPQEAIDRAKSFMAQNKPASPSTIGKRAPVKVAGEDPNAPMVAGGKTVAASTGLKKALPAVGIAAGAAGVLGLGYYALKH